MTESNIFQTLDNQYLVFIHAFSYALWLVKTPQNTFELFWATYWEDVPHRSLAASWKTTDPVPNLLNTISAETQKQVEDWSVILQNVEILDTHIVEGFAHARSIVQQGLRKR